MAEKTRVLVVDDSVVMRRMLSEIIASDPELEVAGTAVNGRIAIQKLPQLCPDIVTLDVEMPELDGLETLREIRRDYARLPVVMFSSLTERAASATLQALSLGATDYVTKPSGTGNMATSVQRTKDELLPKLRALGRLARGKSRHGPQVTSSSPPGLLRSEAMATRSSSPPAPTPVRTLVTSGPFARVDVVAIGTSTGGPNALAEIFSKFPARFPVPIFITQHMPPVFTRLLAERLTAGGRVPVKEAASGDLVEPGRAYIAPGDFHMTLVRDGAAVRVRLNQEPPENSCRPAVDPMFRSVVDIYGAGTLATICTGMGQDGLRGCERVRDVGGQIVAQDEATSVVWGMPGFVVRAGLAHVVLPLADIAGEITRRTNLRRIVRVA